MGIQLITRCHRVAPSSLIQMTAAHSPYLMRIFLIFATNAPNAQLLYKKLLSTHSNWMTWKWLKLIVKSLTFSLKRLSNVDRKAAVPVRVSRKVSFNRLMCVLEKRITIIQTLTTWLPLIPLTKQRTHIATTTITITTVTRSTRLLRVQRLTKRGNLW